MSSFVQWLGVIKQQGAAQKPPTRSQVAADVAALNRLGPRAVRELDKRPDAQAQQLLLAVARSAMAPSLRQAETSFRGESGFYLYTSLQHWLEEMGVVSGTRGGLTGLPLLPRKGVPSLATHHREVVVDSDQDAVADAFDHDADGDGRRNDDDATDTVRGIPDEFLARSPYDAGQVTKGEAAAAKASPCFFAGEAIPRFTSIAAASRFRTARHCGLLGAGDSIPANVGQPSVTGAATVGSTLTANPGVWTGSPTPTLSYIWRYQDQGGGWPAITGATSSTYTLQSSDVGHLVRVDVSATNSAGSAAQASPEVGPVKTSGNDTPEPVTAPTVSGTAAVGSLLTATPGEWTGSPTSYSYQWQRGSGGSWAAISGATAQSYVPVTADIGDQLRIRVMANTSDSQGSATSDPTAVVPTPAAAPSNTTLPSVSGTAQVGRVLTASPGTWTGSPTFSYAWQRSTASGSWTSIDGAEETTYTPTAADVGGALRIQVTGTNDAGRVVTQSAETSPVVASGGCTVSADTDTDGDKVPDCKELAGFTLTIATTGTGSTTTRKTASDPTIKDTDGDGVSDYAEWAGFVSDPDDVDTDGDELDDYQELVLYQSLPTNVDSDGDALVPGSNPRSADPRLLDGREVDGYDLDGLTISTSPILADTDGDSLSDYTEISTGGYNPLVADMPELQVDVPSNVSTDIQVFTTRTDTGEKVNYSGSLNESTDTESTHTVDLTNTQTIDKHSDTLSEGVKAGYAKGQPYVEAKIDNSSTWEGGTVTDAQTGYTKDSTQTTQQQYQQYTQDTTSHSVTTAPTGTLSTAVSLHNPGKISYTAKDLVVTAFQQDPDAPGAIEPIATLELPDTVQAGLTLAPGDTKGPYQVSSATVSTDKLLGLLAVPGSLIYTVESPSLTNPVTGVSYATIGQNVNAQTATVSIDDGSDDPVTYRVATNVRRTADGKAAGISMDQAMTTLGQSYATCSQNDGSQVLCKVNTVATVDQHHAWSVLASDDVTLGVDFDKIGLPQGAEVRLTYLVDSDGDELFDPQENLYGTSPTNADTDGDGLNDYAETRTGWTVPAIGPQAAYQTYSNPLTSDIDGDGSHDACPGQAAICGTSDYAPESVRLTDPDNPDTNSDGVQDGRQADDAVLSYCPGCRRTPTYQTSIGSQGNDDGQFGEYGPDAVAVDTRNGFLYVVDGANSRIEKFDLTGKFVTAIGSFGPGAGQFEELTDVAVDSRGNILALEGDGMLSQFAPNGSFIRQAQVSRLGARVAVDSSGYIYVINILDQILKVNADLTPVTTLDVSAAQLSQPTSIAVDNTGTIYVTNVTMSDKPAENFVAKLDAKGQLLDRWTSEGTLFNHPTGITIDPHGYVYVSDTDTDTVVKVDSAGNVLVTFGGPGTGLGLFKNPGEIDLDASCNVYVADILNYRVQVFGYSTGCN